MAVTTCSKCGKEIKPRGLLNHERFCKGIVEDDGATLTGTGEEIEEATEKQVELTGSMPVSIPLSVCPKELAYLKANKQIHLQVAGRKIGDRFFVDTTRLIR